MLVLRGVGSWICLSVRRKRLKGKYWKKKNDYAKRLMNDQKRILRKLKKKKQVELSKKETKKIGSLSQRCKKDLKSNALKGRAYKVR